jgi:hypothetical protein
MVTIFRASRVQAAEMIALVDAIAGIMFFTTPCTTSEISLCCFLHKEISEINNIPVSMNM